MSFVQDRSERKIAFHLVLFAFSIPFTVGFLLAWDNIVGPLLIMLGAIPIFFLYLLASYKILCLVMPYREVSYFREKCLLLLLTPIPTVLMILSTLPIIWFGRFSGTYVNLIVNYSYYEEIVEKASSNPNGDKNGHYFVDKGPPVRVAFSQGGFLDNWSGIVYDPSGEVMQADGFDPETGKFAAPDRITKLFYGDLLSCRHLWGNYYKCYFT